MKNVAIKFTEQEENELKNIIRKEMQQRGVYFKTDEIELCQPENEDWFKIKTPSIIMQPSMFDELHIEGYGKVEENTDVQIDASVYTIWLPLEWRYTHYDGGENGCKIKNIHIRMIRFQTYTSVTYIH